ncbi:RNA polymerase sigma-70 factor, ECF subfamily [Ruegeria halocynthiae]|uniref:RNA polymerase sigma-70 factor, ECF subfamily n=1 Tax=Ruegeria halocynthiae TaxID=985054 RepID=A0A1H3AAB3_9RHOB|nr:RNA polymerase sigma factor [Ruegeria halocynthiae]SDX25809.1 RNA polymerase sigma-70 factor, ECF subfamily [Ruegeria halocynthiae]
MKIQTSLRQQASSNVAKSEAELVSAAREGSELAVRELIRRLNPRLFRVARGIVDSDAEAEEALQDAYLSAFSKLKGFREQARFSTWITRIVINTSRMQRRRAPVSEEYDTVDEISTPRVIMFPGQSSELPDATLGRAQLRDLLETAVSDLPPHLRLPFLLREAEDMSILAIASELQINPITVKTRLFRARHRLRITIEHRIRGGFEAIFPFGGKRCANMTSFVVARLQADGAL